MKLKNWNWFNKICGAVLFAFWVSLLVEPWLISLNKFFNYTKTGIYNISWVAWVIISGIIFQSLVKIYDKKYYIYTGFIILLGVNILVLYFIDWPFLVFIPALLILILSSFRFEFYNKGPIFIFDFIVATLILLLNIILYYNTGLNLNIYTNVILFFIIAIFLSILFNFNRIQQYEYSIKPGVLLSVIGAFIFLVILPGLFLGFSLERSFFEGILTFFGWGIRLIGYLVLGIIYPLLRILSPLLEYVADIELDTPEIENEGQENNDFQEDLSKNIESEVQGESFLRFLPYVLWGLLVIFLAWLIYRVIKKILNRRSKEKVKKGYIEERETIFSMENLKNNFRGLLNNINIFSKNKKRKRTYNRDNPADIIREIYFKFLIKYNEVVKYNIYFTPNEYSGRLKKNINKEKYIQELTRLYNKVRYGNKVNENDVDKAQDIWNEIKKK